MKKSDFYEKNARFSHFIAYYGRLLKYQNASYDLWSFLWELHNARGETLTDEYIRTCVYHEYIRLSKIETKNKLWELLESDVCAPVIDTDLKLDIATAFDRLTRKEQEVLRLSLNFGYSGQEIANIKKCTRQAVCKMRSSALKKMRALL